MNREKSIIVTRDCQAVMIPSGERTTLIAGSSVWLTQSLGGTYTVMTDRGYMVRIDGMDGDAIGMARVPENAQEAAGTVDSGEEIERRVWEQLKSCFDPEIPVNIVDLGLIYHCAVTPLSRRRIQSGRALYSNGSRLWHGPVSKSGYRKKTVRRFRFAGR